MNNTPNLTDEEFDELTKLFKAATSAMGQDRAQHLVRESAEMMMMRRASSEAVQIMSAIVKS